MQGGRSKRQTLITSPYEKRVPIGLQESRETHLRAPANRDSSRLLHLPVFSPGRTRSLLNIGQFLIALILNRIIISENNSTYSPKFLLQILEIKQSVLIKT